MTQNGTLLPSDAISHPAPSRSWLPAFAALGLLALAACSESTPTAQTEVQPTEAPIDASPSRPTLTAPGLSKAEIFGLDRNGLRLAILDLSKKRFGTPPRAIHIIRVSEATWSDASLGCPEPGMLYAQVLTQGLWVILSHQGREYDYRTTFSHARLCAQSDSRPPLEQRTLPGVWSSLAPVPTARSEVAAAEVNGRIYVFGGFGSGATANEEYNILTNAWRKRAPIPRRLDHTAAVALDGLIYLIGGFDGSFRPVNDVWAYDPITDAWDRRADLPTARGALGAVAIDGLIYSIGGRGAREDVGAVEVYDPAADEWTARAPMPTPRDHVAISVVEGSIYVIGGRLGTFARNLADNQRYDPATDSWSQRSPLPTPRSGIGAATAGGRVYVFGGEEVEGTFDANESYDPVADRWESMPPLPTARHGLAAVAVGNRIYVLAGGPTPGGSASAHNEVLILLSLP